MRPPHNSGTPTRHNRTRATRTCKPFLAHRVLLNHIQFEFGDPARRVGHQILLRPQHLNPNRGRQFVSRTRRPERSRVRQPPESCCVVAVDSAA
jgi:hypothetical protein